MWCGHWESFLQEQSSYLWTYFSIGEIISSVYKLQNAIQSHICMLFCISSIPICSSILQPIVHEESPLHTVQIASSALRVTLERIISYCSSRSLHTRRSPDHKFLIPSPNPVEAHLLNLSRRVQDWPCRFQALSSCNAIFLPTPGTPLGQ